MHICINKIITDEMCVKEAIDIDEARRLPSRTLGPRPVLVTFRSFKQKLAVLKSTAKLKGKDIHVSQDFSESVRLQRRKLKPFLDKAREEKQFAMFRYDKLQIDNKLFKLDASGEKLVFVKNLPSHTQSSETNTT